MAHDPVDVVAALRDAWLVRDLTHHDFNEAISVLIKIREKKKEST